MSTRKRTSADSTTNSIDSARRCASCLCSSDTGLGRFLALSFCISFLTRQKESSVCDALLPVWFDAKPVGNYFPHLPSEVKTNGNGEQQCLFLRLTFICWLSSGRPDDAYSGFDNRRTMESRVLSLPTVPLASKRSSRRTRVTDSGKWPERNDPGIVETFSDLRRERCAFLTRRND